MCQIWIQIKQNRAEKLGSDSMIWFDNILWFRFWFNSNSNSVSMYTIAIAFPKWWAAVSPGIQIHQYTNPLTECWQSFPSASPFLSSAFGPETFIALHDMTWTWNKCLKVAKSYQPCFFYYCHCHFWFLISSTLDSDGSDSDSNVSSAMWQCDSVTMWQWQWHIQQYSTMLCKPRREHIIKYGHWRFVDSQHTFLP